jgi:hypothetical protein
VSWLVTRDFKATRVRERHFDDTETAELQLLRLKAQPKTYRAPSREEGISPAGNGKAGQD